MRLERYTKLRQWIKTKSVQKAAMLLLSLALLLTLLVGGTVAHLVASDGPITNTFKDSTVSCTVTETFSNNEKTNVAIQNTGDTSAYIRAAVVVTWKDGNGNVYGGQPVAGTDYTIELNSTDWFLDSDGFYYYKNSVAAGSSTGNLINRCAPEAGRAPEGYTLNVEILGSAIQSAPASVVSSQWDVTVTDGALSQ